MLRRGARASFRGRSLLVLALLLLLLGFARACRELLSSGCSCQVERAKGHTVQAGARQRVSCASKELTETPEVSLMPNRTISL